MAAPIAIEGKNAKPPNRGTACLCIFRWLGWSKKPYFRQKAIISGIINAVNIAPTRKANKIYEHNEDITLSG
ncbi:MAG: hypothetical protein K6F94_09680 [Bacteroidaceae bacterium]|nr:hypothetical protein [Bacteroidaceae bacterium]